MQLQDEFKSFYSLHRQFPSYSILNLLQARIVKDILDGQNNVPRFYLHHRIQRSNCHFLSLEHIYLFMQQFEFLQRIDHYINVCLRDLLQNCKILLKQQYYDRKKSQNCLILWKSLNIHPQNQVFCAAIQQLRQKYFLFLKKQESYHQFQYLTFFQSFILHFKVHISRLFLGNMKQFKQHFHFAPTSYKSHQQSGLCRQIQKLLKRQQSQLQIQQLIKLVHKGLVSSQTIQKIITDINKPIIRSMINDQMLIHLNHIVQQFIFQFKFICFQYNQIFMTQFNFYSVCAFVLFKMKKRKLDINQIKKLAIRGRQTRTITTKYEVVLSFFKQKDGKFTRIFTVQLETLITDLIDQLSNAEITYKLQNSLQGQIHPVEVYKDSLKLDTSCLKYICKQFPIRQLVDCLEIKKDSSSKKVIIEVFNTKLMNFFKLLRSIFPEFCSSVGEKIIVDSYDLRSFYQTFKCEWNKLHERGRMENSQKIQKLLCRSLFFLGAIIENNIFAEIESSQRLKREEAADISTKSEKKPALKGINNQVSSTYSFGGQIDLMSHHPSSCLMSQKSNQQSFCKTGYSEKSERLARKQRNSILWDRAQIKSLKIIIKPTPFQQKPIQSSKFEIDLLSNDVENILIEQAFKIQRFKAESEKYRHSNEYLYNTYLNYYPPYYGHIQSPFIYTQILGSQQNRMSQNQGKRNTSNNHTNLVQIRKTHSRLESNKYS